MSLCLAKKKLQNLFKNKLKGFNMERDLEKILIDFLLGIVILGLFAILFKVIGFLLKRLFTFFRL